jgi:SAM-dependent methyltransferase
MSTPLVARIVTADDTYRRRTRCRLCDSADLDDVLRLGPMPLANEFQACADASEDVFPLDLQWCKACGLVQVVDVISPARLFHGYAYSTSASRPLVAHFTQQARRLAADYLRDQNDLVVEVGSNSGCFLHPLKDVARVIGIDPSVAHVQMAGKRGVPTIGAFFSRELARALRLEHGQAQLIYAANVLAHVDDLDDFLQGVTTLLAPDGIFVMEVHWFADMLESTGFDQTYHEHLSYFTLRTLTALLKRHDLSVRKVRVIEIHGRSLQVHAGHRAEEGTASQDEGSAPVLARETQAGVTNQGALIEFGERVARLKETLVAKLDRIKSVGGRIAGYGAPAKGNVLLNYCGIGRERLDYLVDSTPYKQGLYAPGSRLPVHAREHLAVSPVDHLLLLAWNYRDAIFELERHLIESGVQFIVPLPFI